MLRPEADRYGHFMDTDAPGTKCRSQVRSFARNLVGQLSSVGQVSISHVRASGTTRDDGSPHVQGATNRCLRTPGRRRGGVNGALQRDEAGGVCAGREERLGAHVRSGGLKKRVGCTIGCPAHQVDEPRGQVVCTVLVSKGIGGTSGGGQQSRGIAVLGTGSRMHVPNGIGQQTGDGVGDPAVLGTEPPAHGGGDLVGELLRGTHRRAQWKVVSDDRLREGGQCLVDAPLCARVPRAQLCGVHAEGIGDRFKDLVAGAAGASFDGPNSRVRNVGGCSEGDLREAACSAVSGNALTDLARAVSRHPPNVLVR